MKKYIYLPIYIYFFVLSISLYLFHKRYFDEFELCLTLISVVVIEIISLNFKYIVSFFKFILKKIVSFLK